jgi:hypothetical protein
MFHAYIISVLSGYCICLQWFQVFLDILLSVSDAYLKCFISLKTYVALDDSKLD